jgi:predicted TIM-barrel fold metal-dependent hydrolase
MRPLDRKPSEYFFDHVHVTFQDDPIALALTRHLNPRMLLWANDYPHSDASWPWSRNILAEHMRHLSDQEKRWILHDNVKELYNLPVE